MNKLNFLLLLFFIPNTAPAYNVKSLDSKLKQIRAKAIQSIDASLQKKMSILQQEGDLLKKGEPWKTVNKALKVLKKTSEYESLHALQEALNLLFTVENLTLKQPQPQLLDAVSSLLQSSNSLGQPYRSFFQKERARLMDGADENILIKTKQTTIIKLRNSLLKELQEALEKLKDLEEYTALEAAYNRHFNDKRTKKTKTLIEKIQSLEQEKAIQLLTNKQYLSIKNEKALLLKQTNTPSPQKHSIEDPNLTLSAQLDLLIAPLELLIL